jgi:hypothetical protein
MKKLSLSLLAASAMAVAGLAQADAIFYPDGRVVELGASDRGSDGDNLMLSSSSSLDTSVLGAGAATELWTSGESSPDTTVLGAGPSTTTRTVTTTEYAYVQPNINWDRATALAQMRSNAHLMRANRRMDRSAAATFDSPTRAGEASTMTGGSPNAMTSNDRMIVGSYTIRYSTVTEPYYVFSY